MNPNEASQTYDIYLHRSHCEWISRSGCLARYSRKVKPCCSTMCVTIAARLWKVGFSSVKIFLWFYIFIRFSCDHLFEVLLQRAHWKVHWFHLLSFPLGFPPSSPSSFPPTITIIFFSFSWLMKLLVPPPSSWGPAKSSKNRPCYHWDCSVCSAQILTHRSALLVQFACAISIIANVCLNLPYLHSWNHRL